MRLMPCYWVGARPASVAGEWPDRFPAALMARPEFTLCRLVYVIGHTLPGGSTVTCTGGSK